MANISTCSNAAILARCEQMSDRKWFDLLDKSAENKPTDGIELPGFPSEEFQIASIGSAGTTALIEGQRFYTLIKHYADRLGVTLDPQETAIMDFGCGWGRMTRFFLKDVAAENLYGVDVTPSMIETCKSTIPHGNFSVIGAEPPTTFAANSFDIIFAYSVFTHLPENVHIKWIQEFSRLLKPGGILVITTQPRKFIALCESFRREPGESIWHDGLVKWIKGFSRLLKQEGILVVATQPRRLLALRESFRRKPSESIWHDNLANSFLDIDAAYADYDSGKFLYSATGGGPEREASVYGEALIPREYVEREWTRYLKFRDFFDDVKVLFQAVIVMQKDDDNS
jgi:cyclopropane fatty-acyl-phospholipid synthase-like methyltransferase